MKNKYVYVYYSKDKYRLPIAVADTAAQLAKMLSIKPKSIYQMMSRAKREGKECRFAKVKIE
mgnify:CR=1 FL=1|nr:MAG TPA: Protein of unknown function (DUF1580) [Caudoviricetes sp.]